MKTKMMGYGISALGIIEILKHQAILLTWVRGGYIL